MAEETAVAASSAAVMEAPKFTQFDGWNEDGEPVVSKKAPTQEKPVRAESATAEETETAGDTKVDDEAEHAAAKKPETRRKPDAEARIKELSARAKQLERELEKARKPKETKNAESSTARQTDTRPATPEAAPGTRPKPQLGEKDAEGKPKYASYEDYTEDLIGWKAEQIVAKQEQARQAQQQQQALSKQLDEARGRYTDFDSVAKPLIEDMLKPEISREVFAVINDSPVLADLLYTIGGTAATRADFLEACRHNPGKALRVALLMEQEIVKELGKGKAAGVQDGARETAPATPKPRAPKPPAEVGGRGASGEDALITAAKARDFRSFDAEQTRRALASRR